MDGVAGWSAGVGWIGAWGYGVAGGGEECGADDGEYRRAAVDSWGAGIAAGWVEEVKDLFGAGGTGAVDEELVADVSKAAGKFGFGLHLAAFELVDGAADVALEVMVVGFAGDLVAGGVAGNFDRREPFVFDEAADVAVDGGDAEGVDLFLGEGEGFVGGERAIGFEEGGADGLFLTGVAGLNGNCHGQAYLSVLRGWSQLRIGRDSRRPSGPLCVGITLSGPVS